MPGMMKAINRREQGTSFAFGNVFPYSAQHEVYQRRPGRNRPTQVMASVRGFASWTFDGRDGEHKADHEK